MDLPFDSVSLVDFEFSQSPGERPTPVCLVAWEIKSGRRWRLFQDEIVALPTAPYPIGANDLVVSYYASAEMGCHLALGWPLPVNVLDLYAEFRVATNGAKPTCGNGLLGALTYHGLDALAATEKDEMRQLALRGGLYTNQERAGLLDYCESDVAALAKLLPAMAPNLDHPRALLRGRYMKAMAVMEHTGTPIDTVALEALKANWEAMIAALIERVDKDYGVYEGRTFKMAKLEQWVAERGVTWPRTSTGQLELKVDTFKDMAKVYPELNPLKELRTTISQLRLHELLVGADGRNRCMLSAYSSVTGRNQPSGTKFIFGPAVWLRGLIKPAPCHGLAYIDWSQQEFGIAAALSGDGKMQEAYRSGDPYLAFAKQAGAAPPEATKQTHKRVREQFKTAALGVQYDMGADTLAKRIGGSRTEARELLALHRRTYRQFWRWSEAVIDYAVLRGRIFTVFGWQMRVGPNTKPQTLRNFPMQANGAEMLRIACCLATERRIRVCAPVHDALLIEAPLGQLGEAVYQTQEAMREASRIVLGGFELSSDAKIIRHPDRYMDGRGQGIWAMVWDTVHGLQDAA